MSQEDPLVDRTMVLMLDAIRTSGGLTRSEVVDRCIIKPACSGGALNPAYIVDHYFDISELLSKYCILVDGTWRINSLYYDGTYVANDGTILQVRKVLRT